MKIAVYAIALNEAKHVERWYNSVKSGADCVVVCDTGSTDLTRMRMSDLLIGDIPTINIKPFRFDHARNAALALVPEDVDVCIALDLDEVLLPGWRHHVEAHMDHGATRMTYGFDLDRGRKMIGHRIHARHAYDWKYPIHEALVAKRGVVEDVRRCISTIIAHQPDDTKSRRQYLGMLANAVQEYPEDSRMAFYYGRELMFGEHWDKAIAVFKRYLDLDKNWRQQRAEAMRYIGRCEERLGNENTATMNFVSACHEWPDRGNWLELADNYRRRKDWAPGLWAVQRALEWPDEPDAGTFDPRTLTIGPYDIGGVCAFYAGQKELAAQWLRKAHEMDPADERMAKNLSFVTPS